MAICLALRWERRTTDRWARRMKTRVEALQRHIDFPFDVGRLEWSCDCNTSLGVNEYSMPT
jgi:hypothetical protein